jgi:DNA-binding LacI/PurR family transcriptional regulator
MQHNGFVSDRPVPRRRVTMEDVAAEAGVSRALVSLVVRDAPHVTPGKRAAVTAAIERLGYRRNRLASRLASHRTATIGLLLLDLRNPVWSDIADGVTSTVEARGFHVLVAVGSTDLEREKEALQAMDEMHVDGLMLAGYMGTANTLRPIAGETPAVVLTRHVRARGVDSVVGGDAAGAALAVDHLVSLGHSRIAHVSSPRTLPYPARLSGYRTAMQRHGLMPWVYEGDLTERGGAAAVRELFGSGMSGREVPTAIFCYNDLSAIGVMEELDRRGIRVPEDVAVIGYDNTEVGSLRRIGLTSVDQHARTIGLRGAELLLARIDGPGGGSVLESLTPELIVRSSTDPTAGGLDSSVEPREG